MTMLLRSMSPQIIAVDEIGDKEDYEIGYTTKIPDFKYSNKISISHKQLLFHNVAFATLTDSQIKKLNT